MRRNLALFAVFLLTLAATSGCTTAYKAAVEERSLSTQVADTKIKGTIVEKFVADDKVKALDISPECYEGHVYLLGEYDTAAQKDRAVEIAGKVEGVKKITTYLLPKKKDDACGTSANLKITAAVTAELIKDKDIWSTNVNVKTVQCNVVLLGIVGTKDEANKSIAHARGVEGVRKVVSYLKPVK